MQWPSSTTTPSQSEIFFPSCYCRLLSLLVCMYWPFKTKHPPKVKYFFKSVIVDCSLCSYVCIGLSWPNTLPKWNIFFKSIIVACSLSNERELLMEANINISHTVKLTVSLLGRMWRPWKDTACQQRTSYNNKFEKIFHFGRVLWSWEETPYEQATITAFQRIFHFGRVYWSWKANTYIRAERAIYNNRFEKIFHFGRVYWSWKANTYEQVTITENISLWEGVWSWKANTYEQVAITENISLWEGVWSWKANTYEQVTITENISLWEGVLVLKGQYIHTSRESNLQ